MVRRVAAGTVGQGGNHWRAGPSRRARLALRRIGRLAACRGGRLAAVGAAAFLLPAGSWAPAGNVTPSQISGTSGQVRTLARSASEVIPGGQPTSPEVAPLKHLLHADVIVVSAQPLPARAVTAVRRLPGVQAAVTADAARVTVNGKDIAVLGVDPSRFRGFAAKPTAADTGLWRSVAGGAIAVSYTMGRQDKLPAGSLVRVSGHQDEMLPVGGLGTVGIGGVDGVVSTAVARSLGFPAHNAIVISAPRAAMATLTKHIKAVMPGSAAVEPLAVTGRAARAGQAGAVPTAGTRLSQLGYALTRTQVATMLKAAVSRLGMPYVWGAEGPKTFDCSGLVQWSFAQAGVAMPRVAADQARTGPFVPVSRLRAGDLLFYHTDPTAPNYISHVAIYLGNGWMIQAPQPGESVQVVPLALGGEYAGAVAVAPRVAAAAAAAPVG
jgi:peptidoglycan DL-endopeptidase CwlO